MVLETRPAGVLLEPWSMKLATCYCTTMLYVHSSNAPHAHPSNVPHHTHPSNAPHGLCTHIQCPPCTPIQCPGPGIAPSMYTHPMSPCTPIQCLHVHPSNVPHIHPPCTPIQCPHVHPSNVPMYTHPGLWGDCHLLLYPYGVA